ncbi:hypothetical protein BH11ARM2_BH11ARM2_20010 [soil metagenome]
MTGSEPVSLLKWSLRGRDDRPEGVRAILAAMFVAAGLGAWLLGPAWTIAGPAIIAFSMADFLFGRQFELTDRDARSRVFFSLSAINWTDVRRVILREKSLLLSPLGQTSWRDGFRGIQLDLPPSLKERVLEIVRDRMPADATYSEE